MTALRSPLVLTGGATVAVLAAVAVFAPALAPYDPRAVVGESLQPPSTRHLLGTNSVGQDLFSQLVWGARASLAVAVGAACLTVVVGVAVGVGAGVAGGTADLVAARVVDTFLALPVLPLLVVVAALAGPSRRHVILAIGLVAWPGLARIIRSQTLTLRHRGFVHAARGFGTGPLYIARRHLIPALGPLVAVGFVNMAGISVLLEAGLAFLGLGDPAAVSWGLVLNRAVRHQGLYFSPLWTWWVLPPGLAITLTVLAFTFLALGLEPILNRRSQRT